MNTKAEPSTDVTVAVVKFKFEKETKNTYRFQEIDAAGKVVDRFEASIGTLYLKKLYFTQKPDWVTVTITTN
jgi:hypothetical protein